MFLLLLLYHIVNHDLPPPKGESKLDLASHGTPFLYSQWFVRCMCAPSRAKQSIHAIQYMGTGSKTLLFLSDHVRVWAWQSFLPHGENFKSTLKPLMHLWNIQRESPDNITWACLESSVRRTKISIFCFSWMLLDFCHFHPRVLMSTKLCSAQNCEAPMFKVI